MAGGWSSFPKYEGLAPTAYPLRVSRQRASRSISWKSHGESPPAISRWVAPAATYASQSLRLSNNLETNCNCSGCWPRRPFLAHFTQVTN